LSSPGKITSVDPANPPLAVIFGLRGKVLSDEQKAFFKDKNPLGFILFGNNVQNGQNGNIGDPAQLKALTADLQSLLGRNVPILIDQEGGRVARLKPPHWSVWPAARVAGDIAKYDMALATRNTDAVNRSIAQTLLDVGINVNCAPCLDVAFPQTHAVIGDRAFSDDPAVVGELGIAACKAYLSEGVIPVVKHMPGHGRAAADSHLTLPVVNTDLATLKNTDLAPYFALLRQKFAMAVWGMVSHIIYTDSDPANPASCSPAVLDLIRKDLGFDGLLLTDDIVMGALSVVGDMGQRAAASIKAGCDVVLHCNGDMNEMKQVAQAAGVMTPDAIRRFNLSIA
jgi:beta-N-acetylhexosaminidase